MFSVFLAAIGRSRATHRSGSQGTAQVSERGEDLLVGGMIRKRGRHPGRLRGGLVVVLPGEGDEGLAADLQVTDLLVKFTEPGGELLDPGLGLPGLAGQGLLPRVDRVQQEPARVRRGHAADRHDGTEVPVSRRAITSVIAQ